MANSLPMLNLRSSGFNIGPADAEPFAQYQSSEEPARPCLAKATVLRAMGLLNACRLNRPLAPPGALSAPPCDALSAANGQAPGESVFGLPIKGHITLSAWQDSPAQYGHARQPA